MRRPILIDDPNTPVPADALDKPGGFAWWYSEISDGQGNGVVLIWSWGLPFLPGLASDARRGQPQLPRDKPSLNVVVYQDGKPAVYVLRELKNSDAHYDPAGYWRFGETTIRASVTDGQMMVDADVHVPVAGCDEPLTGRIRLSGPVPSGLGCEPGEGHRWTPLALPAFGTALLRRPDGSRVRVAGKAYHDRNTSPVPLHSLGIERWVWGRAGLPDGEKLFYVLEPTSDAAADGPLCFGISVDLSGRARRHALTPRLEGNQRTLYGLRACREITLFEGDAVSDRVPWLALRLGKPVDDGPFYRRYLPQVDGTDACASAELIEPGRIDLDRHRMLVRMRVDSEQRDNSVWLPLFQGPSDGRVRRLLQSWVGS